MPKVLLPGNKFSVFGRKFTVLNINFARGDILCVCEKWKSDSFDDDISLDCTNNYAIASIRKLLNITFFASAINTSIDKDLFVPMPIDIVDNFGDRNYGMVRDYVRLLTQQEFLDYSKYLDINDWAWTMTPYKCQKTEKSIGDHCVSVADSKGRWGHQNASKKADIYPVVQFRQKVSFHETFKLIRK